MMIKGRALEIPALALADSGPSCKFARAEFKRAEINALHSKIISFLGQKQLLVKIG
jgi:hypothetical protein